MVQDMQERCGARHANPANNLQKDALESGLTKHRDQEEACVDNVGRGKTGACTG